MAAIRTQREIRQRAPWWLAGLLLANFLLMSYDARDYTNNQRVVQSWAQTFAYPVQRAAAFIGNHTTNVFQGFGEMRQASSENQQLRETVARMETELRDNRGKAAEADRLRALLGLKQKSNYTMVAARIIARDPSAWFDTITIDKGRLEGIENNMPVVAASGIVGRIVATGPLSAQVMLITDERSGVGAVVGELGTSHAFGSIKGMGDNGLLDMRFVSSLEKVQPGETVTTTGQDGIYPAGFAVGQVVEIRSGAATENQLIHLRPAAGLDRLEEVAVLLYRPPQRRDSDQALPNVEKKARSKQDTER